MKIKNNNYEIKKNAQYQYKIRKKIYLRSHINLENQVPIIIKIWIQLTFQIIYHYFILKYSSNYPHTKKLLRILNLSFAFYIEIKLE